MAASNEWEVVHLTPTGWVDGSYKHDAQDRVELPVPGDAVLSVKRRVYVAAVQAHPEIEETETPLIEDKSRISELLAQFGKPQFAV